MDKDYYKIDLHIHTPSSVCYQEDSDADDIYYRIIETACENKLEIIAITDHNTLAGYERIVSLKEKLKSEFEILRKYNVNSFEMTSLLTEMELKIKNFENLLILPGVEVTVNPGIHIIIICNPDNISNLKQYLKDIGYSDELAGKDSLSDILTDVKQILDEPKLHDSIIIAPHVDSDKGIYNDLRGQYRASIFKNEHLMCLTCNSPVQQQRITDLYFHDPAYKRIPLPAFLNASDSHSLSGIGSRYSLIKLRSFDFDGVFTALQNPSETIKSPEIKSEIESIISQDENYAFIEKYTEDTVTEISRYLCAHLNTSGISNIILGACEKPQLTCHGINLNEEKIKELVDKAFRLLSSYSRLYKFKIRIETLGNSCNIAIVKTLSEPSHLWCIKDGEEVFIYDKKNKVKKATIFEVERIVKQKLIKSLKTLDSSKNFTIDKTINLLNTIRNPISQFETIEKINEASISIRDVFEIDYVDNNLMSQQLETHLIKNYEQGEAYGNVYYLYAQHLPGGPHYKDVYLRCSCTCFSSKDISIDDLKEYKGPKLILTNFGAAYIIEGDSWYLAHTPIDIFLLTLNDMAAKKLSIYGLLGWLKSSAFLWYMQTKFNCINLFDSDTHDNVPIPLMEILAPGGTIEQKIKEIILLEKEYLNTCEKTIYSEDCIDCTSQTRPEACVDGCQIDKLSEIHNNKVLCIAKNIDSIFFNTLKISKENIRVISDNMTNYGLYNYIDIED